ncbi:unnamed protein product [Cyclocybe aegerita]|uniref:Uncharacterized protein n=1 Tax=Cyclocybe aegerita TaxID=1973307 RepID=A0A8S0WLU5_CYCAE|nr:unnamed protein product [Cyclocybe aegerita]
MLCIIDPGPCPPPHSPSSHQTALNAKKASQDPTCAVCPSPLCRDVGQRHPMASPLPPRAFASTPHALAPHSPPPAPLPALQWQDNEDNGHLYQLEKYRNTRQFPNYESKPWRAICYLPLWEGSPNKREGLPGAWHLQG